MERSAKPSIWPLMKDEIIAENDGERWTRERKKALLKFFAITPDKIKDAANIFGRSCGAIQMQLFSMFDAGRFGATEKDFKEYDELKAELGVIGQMCFLDEGFQDDIYERTKNHGWNLNPKIDKLVFTKR